MRSMWFVGLMALGLAGRRLARARPRPLALS
jgi:hypothetical protein